MGVPHLLTRRTQRRLALGFVAGVLAVGTVLACKDPDIHSVNRTVTVSGHYCTNNSTSFHVPIKVLLVIDVSGSMAVNDPNGGRGKAAQKLVAALQAKGIDVSFGFIQF